VAELLAATMIAGIVSVSAYGLFEHVMRIEKEEGARWRNRSRAEAVVSHLAGALEQAVNLPGVTALSVRREEEGGGHSMVCLVGGDGGLVPSDCALRRRRYRWGFEDEDERAGKVELQEIPYAGSRDIGALTGAEEPVEDEQLWDRVAPVCVAKGLADLAIRLRPLDSPDSDWTDRWSGPSGNVVIRIRATAGAETVERTVVPMANAQAFD
jgi:hypothetical protein